jgi:hypothetical protein
MTALPLAQRDAPKQGGPIVRPSLTWMHTDSRGFPSAVAQAVDRAKGGGAGSWKADFWPGSAGTRLQDLRALIAASLYLAQKFSEREPTLANDVVQLSDPALGPFANDERRLVALTLLATPHALLRGNSNVPAPRSLATVDDGANKAPPEAALVWLKALAIVAGVTAATVCIWHCIDKGAQVVDRELARTDDTMRLAAAHAAAVQMAANHTNAEEKAGKTLPLNEAERAVLDQLGSLQQQVIAAKAAEKPIPETPIVSTTTTGSFFSGAGLALAAVAAVVLFTNR